MERSEELFKRICSIGESAIDEFISSRESEHLFLDFKRSSNHGDGVRLSDIDKNNLAKAISGFGNSEGGVVVWGVDCSKGKDGADVAEMKIPLTDAKKFESWLNGAISGCTIPAHNQVVNHSVVMGNGTQGFVVTHIPKSNNAPHQVVGKSQYYIRAGSDFVPAPHAVLAGMFGRRPQPSMRKDVLIHPIQIDHDVVTIDFDFYVYNDGPGIADDIFLDVMILSQPGSNCQIAFDKTDFTRWHGDFVFARQLWLISSPEIRMPPGARLMPFSMKIILKAPYTQPLELEGHFGCRNWPSTKFRIVRHKDEVNSLFDQILKANVSGELTEKFETNWVSRLLKYE